MKTQARRRGDAPGQMEDRRPDLKLSVPAREPWRAHERLRGLERELGPVLARHLSACAEELLFMGSAHPEAQGQTDLSVRLSASRARVEVTNHGFGLDSQEGAPLARVAGRGLDLLERLSDRWGVERGSPTVFWFELERA